MKTLALLIICIIPFALVAVLIEFMPARQAFWIVFFPIFVIGGGYSLYKRYSSKT